MNSFNIYLTGVGGQGIGLLSEVLLRAADHAGLKVKGVDTHGLAQRGGIVVSHLRLGENVHSPLIRSGEADLVISLERHEALRGMNGFLKDSGTLIYYNTSWQPLEVRLNHAEEITEDMLSQQCKAREILEIKVFRPNLEDTYMQNVVLLAAVCKYRLVPNLEKVHYHRAMEDLMDGPMLEKNMDLFAKESGIR
jgi:indolepyruvate ferredoxin oxidoreductase beta subunit